MNITTRDEPLKWLIEGVEAADIVLPEFQRSFVWRRNDVEDLLISILKGYYVGSFILLCIDRDNVPFAPRPVEGLERDPRSLSPQWMLLDGQQRLTSLYYVFHAPESEKATLKNTSYRYHFFLDLNKLEKGEIDDKTVSSERSDWCKYKLGKEHQFETLIIPFTELHSSRWPTWLRNYQNWLYEKGEFSERDAWRQHQDAIHKWEEVINNLYNLEVAIIVFPIVKSDDTTAIDEICTVFEKMNSTGVPLSVFDLATARLYKDGIKLRDLWEKANESCDRLKKFSEGETDPFGVFILRTIALIRGQDVKRKTLINLSPENFKADWKLAVDCIQDALDRIVAENEDGFGVFDPKWLPYSTMIPVLAALLHHIKTHNLDYKAYEAVRKWYWGSIFLERYAGAVESTAHQDFQELLKHFKDVSIQPEVFKDIDKEILADENFSLHSVSRRSAVYKGVVNLLAIRGAKDFRTGDAIAFYTLEDHHIFPQSRLARKKTNDTGEHHKYGSEEINTILNRTLISEGTHRSIHDRWPSAYIPEIVPSVHKTEIMASHFIDKDALAALENDKYDTFLKHRERCILATLRKYLQA
ncbi:MAG: DUF262 domain-containing protein [Anaerolineae bacterium]